MGRVRVRRRQCPPGSVEPEEELFKIAHGQISYRGLNMGRKRGLKFDGRMFQTAQGDGDDYRVGAVNTRCRVNRNVI